MRIFVINLKRSIDRKKKFQKNWHFISKRIEFFEAVDGNDLSENELSKIALHYPSLKLTKGEIGCALSHLAIYKKIVKEDIPMALILEDDAILNNKISHQQIFDLLAKLENQTSLPKNALIFLQNGAKTPLSENAFICQLTPTHSIEEMQSVWLSHAYVVSFEAAQKLSQFLLPIRYEADFWEALRVGTGVRLLAVRPSVIESSDPLFETSSLHKDRFPLASERGKIRGKLLEKEFELRKLRAQFKLFPINRFFARNKFFPVNRFIRNLLISFRKY